jgi:hypothetical protein
LDHIIIETAVGPLVTCGDSRSRTLEINICRARPGADIVAFCAFAVHAGRAVSRFVRSQESAA